MWYKLRAYTNQIGWYKHRAYTNQIVWYKHRAYTNKIVWYKHRAYTNQIGWYKLRAYTNQILHQIFLLKTLKIISIFQIKFRCHGYKNSKWRPKVFKFDLFSLFVEESNGSQLVKIRAKTSFLNDDEPYFTFLSLIMSQNVTWSLPLKNIIAIGPAGYSEGFCQVWYYSVHRCANNVTFNAHARREPSLH